MSDQNLGSTVPCTVCKRQFPENELVTYEKDRICIGCKAEYFQKVREGVEFTTGPLQYSSIGRRFGAVLIDGAIQWVVQIILSLAIVGSVFAGAKTGTNSAAVGGSLLVMILGMVFGFVYYVGFLGWKGATPGKMVLGIKVVKPNGDSIGFGQAFLRYIGMLVSSIILCIGYIIAFFDDEKRTLHDRIAGTRVIYNSQA